MRVKLAIVSALTAIYLTVPFIVFADSTYCYCVLALRELQGIDIYGNADTQIPNHDIREVLPGDVVLFHYPTTDHVALVLSVISAPGSASLSIVEYNYHHCQKDYRIIPVNDPAIRGILRIPN